MRILNYINKTMKIQFIFGLIVLFGFSMGWAQNAKIQVIHNCASPEAATVDIYLDGNKVLDDFKFRQYTRFIDVPPGDHVIAICGPTSTSATDQNVFTSTPIPLAATDVKYVIASGLVSTDGFATNPDGVDIGFKLYLVDGKVNNAGQTNAALTIFHGCTDAPSVKFKEENLNMFLNEEGIKFGELLSLSSGLPPNPYKVGMYAAASNSLVQVYRLDASQLGGKSAIVLASGFLNPANNKDGAAFQIILALGEPDSPVNDALTVATSIDKVLYGPSNQVKLYPNPAHESTTLAFELANSATKGLLNIQDLQGRVVSQQMFEFLPAGVHTKTIDVSALPTGMYLYTLDVNQQRLTGKFIVE